MLPRALHVAGSAGRRWPSCQLLASYQSNRSTPHALLSAMAASVRANQANDDVIAEVKVMHEVLNEHPESGCRLDRVWAREDGTDHIGVLTLAKPALSARLVEEMESCLTQVATCIDPSPLRALIIRSSWPRIFCAGADLKERSRVDPRLVPHVVGTLRKLMHTISTVACPTVAVVEGAALGGGFEMALACDVRVSGDGAVYGLPETRLAIIPGAGGTQRLARLVGGTLAKKLIFTGKRLTPDEVRYILICLS